MKSIVILCFFIVTISCVSNKRLFDQHVITGKYSIISVTLYKDRIPKEYHFTDTVPSFILTFSTPKAQKGRMIGYITLTADTVNKRSGYYCNAHESIKYTLSSQNHDIQMYWNAWHSNQFLSRPPYLSILRKSLNVVYGSVEFSNDSLILVNYSDKEKTKLFSVLKGVKCQ